MDHTEIGEVVKVFDHTVDVRVDKQKECGACGAKSSCHDDESSHIKEKIITALDPLGLRVGQKVKINLESKNLVKASIFIFAFPLLGLFFGGIIGSYIAKTNGYNDYVDLYSIIGGTFGMGIAILGLRKYNKRLEKSNQYYPIVVERI
jgi:sigma-E factor negative regulatory protein RseC